MLKKFNALCEKIQLNPTSALRTDQQFLSWLHERLIFVHGEKKDVDFLGKFRSIIATIPEKRTTVNTTSISEEILKEIEKGTTLSATMTDREFLFFIHDRLCLHYNENPKVDYMNRFRCIISTIPKDQQTISNKKGDEVLKAIQALR